MNITSTPWGTTPDGKEVQLYKLTNAKGMYAEIATIGGVIVTLGVPDRNGDVADITLGFDKAEDYAQRGPYFGALIGRHANRIENASFELNGETYKLAANDGKNHLHGGLRGFDKAVWASEVIEVDGQPALRLQYVSEDGEEGYPGTLNVEVVYSFSDEGELKIEYTAKSDRDTVVNLTNHAYFNLEGHAAGDISEHLLQLNADRFTPVDKECLPTGEIREVQGTPMDFRRLTPIGQGLRSGDEQIENVGGYDHNWIINGNADRPKGGTLAKAGELYAPNSGRVMEVFTTKPGVQFYSGNFLNGQVVGKGGAAYGKRGGLCLETQYFPNAMKHTHFPSPILRAGETYRHITTYKFSAR